MAEIQGTYKREDTTALLVGSYVDAYYEGTLDKFKQLYPEIFKRDGTLKAEYIQAEAIIKRIERDKLFSEYMSGKPQVIMTGEISGVPVKIKVDSLHPDKIEYSIAPSAKMIEYDVLKDQVDKLTKAYKERSLDTSLSWDERRYYYEVAQYYEADPSRYAVAKGYDVIKITGAGGISADGTHADFYNVLNRKKIIYQDNDIKVNSSSTSKAVKGDIMQSGAITGAYNSKNDPDGTKRSAHAETYYASMRNSNKKDIVSAIAKNADVDAKSVSKMFDHLVINKYQLENGYKTFDADYDISQSIQRLREGKNILEHDRLLILHEALEYDLMNNKGLSYEEAHKIANEKYNYQAALDKWLDENEG